MPRTVARYGWVPQLPDARDFGVAIEQWEAVPPSVDLSTSEDMPPVYDQGQLGSCTANAISAALDYENHRQDQKFVTPSRLWIYYQERAMEGTVASDSGAQIRDGIKVVHTLGAPPESVWPYKPEKFATHPTTRAAKDAKSDEAITYQAPAQSLTALQTCLAAKIPVVFGFTVYDSFESEEVAQTGIVAMPKKGEGVAGGHAVMLVGYDNTTDRFKVRNSWGDGWGLSGYFEMPYDYVLSSKLASDFWLIRKTSVAA